MRPGFLAVLLLLCLAACAPQGTIPAGPRPTATITSPPTLPSTPTTLPLESEWVSLDGGRDLAQDPTWACVGGVRIVDGRIELQAGDGYLTVAHARGPYVAFEEDVGVAATLEVVEGGWGALTTFGRLPGDAWWKGIRRLDLSWGDGQLDVTYWDGRKQQPALSRSYPAAASGRAKVGLRSSGGQLAFLVDGREVGRLDNPGLFPDKRAYLGANVPPNGQLVLHDLTVEARRGQEHTVQIAAPSDDLNYVPSQPPLRELADQRGLQIGAAVAAGPLRCEAPYAQALGHEFNVLTTENAMKFGPIHPQRDRYSFDDADAIVAFAEEHDMRVRGHTLVWHQQLPGWVEEGQWTRGELEDVLHEHIATVVGRYRGRVDAWDVVNEAVDKGKLRNTVWHRVIGPEYLDLAFRWAHEADPEALLFYNDYGCEGMNRKSDAIYDLVRGMLERGVPIHGVGLQMHTALTGSPRPEDVLANIARFADLGLEVHITELDVRLRGEPTAAKLDAQAAVYGGLMDACLEAKGCTALVMWGFTDRHSWVPSFREGYGSALILDEQYRPKPAYGALRDVLAVE